MMSEQTVQAAMSIILNAGDARVACKEALDAISAFDFWGRFCICEITFI